MKKINKPQIFQCTGNEKDVISEEIIKDLNISYMEANLDGQTMAKLAQAIKDKNKNSFCRLPFCHTVEAESYGAVVIYDEKVGNRIGQYNIKDENSIWDLQGMDFGKGRLAEVFKAIDSLKEAGEKVILDVTGPISLATSIMDSRLFYKVLRKDKELTNHLFNMIENKTIEFMIESINHGVDMISFADPAGTIDIVGPSVYGKVAGKSVHLILKAIEDKLAGSIVHLCGKTSTSLEYAGYLETRKIKVFGKDYFSMIENAKKEIENIRFVGHRCLKIDYKTNVIIECKTRNIEQEVS